MFRNTHSTFYYVLEELGELDRLHSALFNSIHIQKLNLKTQQDFVTWLALNGVDEAKANKVWESFPVKVAVNKAKDRTTPTRIHSPASIVTRAPLTHLEVHLCLCGKFIGGCGSERQRQEAEIAEQESFDRPFIA